MKARGLKVTFYPFIMMDIPADNALADPWSVAPSQAAYPWRGRITCDPASGQIGSPQGTPGAANQVAQFFSGGSANYRAMILHYANLVMSAGGVDAFMIGSELKALTRGHGITKESMREFIGGLELPADAKQRLMELTPGGYIGLAETLANDI